VEFIATTLKGLESLGFVVTGTQLMSDNNTTFNVEMWGIYTDDVMEAWWGLYSVCAHYKLKNPEKVEGYAKLAYSMCVGEDVTFRGSQQEFLRREGLVSS
jgi:hypothetical protein